MSDPTLGTEVSLNIESIKEALDGFNPETLMPQLDTVFSRVLLICRFAVLIGPVILLILGLIYLFLTPKEANYYLGYRCYFGMGSDKAWQFTQRIAGIVFCGLGVVLTLVMLFMALSFGHMESMAMVWRTVWCLVWQAVLVLIGTLTINGMAMYWFDRKGELRKVSTRKKMEQRALKAQKKSENNEKTE